MMRALTELKKECMSRIGYVNCIVCYENRPKRLLLHHYSYNEKSVTYNKFGNSDDERLKYYANLLDEIKTNPNNFVTLCFNCHTWLEELIRTPKNEFKNRLEICPDELQRDLFLQYAKTLAKRNLQTPFVWHDYKTRIQKPQFIKNILSEIKRHDPVKDRNTIAEIIKNTYVSIETREISLEEFSFSAVLGYGLSDYLSNDFVCPFVIAGRMLETIKEVKKGDKITWIETFNLPHVKPTEFAQKEEIDSKAYVELLESALEPIVSPVSLDLDEILGRPKMTGLDDFFWN